MLIDSELLEHVEEQRAFNASMAELTAMIDAANPETPEGLAAQRAMMEPGGEFVGELVKEAEERTVPGPAGEIAIRVLVPPSVDAVYLSLHGGGMIIGTAGSSDERNWELARYANVAVVCPDYRLAPEHPFPAGNEDCEAVALWLVEHAQSEFGTDRLLIGGESAGGYFSADTLIRLRDRLGGEQRFSGANLAFGVYDLGGTPSQKQVVDGPLLTPLGIERIGRVVLPGRSLEERRVPEISPLYGNLEGLCPALFTVGTKDPLLDDSVFMAGRWELAGNETTLAVYPEGPHGVSGFPTKIGLAAKKRILEYVKARAAG